MAKCTPCLSDGARDLMEKAFPDITPLLNKVMACPPGVVVNFCLGKRGGGGTRAPSEYNVYIGACMRAKNIKGFGNAAPAMKQCAAEWKQRKGR